MKFSRSACAAGILLCLLAAHLSRAGAAIEGQVIDETSAPLAGVTVAMQGFEELEDGRWRRNRYSGAMPRFQTDGNGRFSIRTDPHRRYDFYADKYNYGPTFVSRVSHDATTLTMVLGPGVAISGKAMRRSGSGEFVPLRDTALMLRLPGEDFWYQQSTATDSDGRYLVRASILSPESEKWQIRFMGETVLLDVVSTASMAGPDFNVTVDVNPD